MDSKQLSVLLIDDHRLFVESLRVALQAHGEFNVVGIATTTAEGLQLARALSPDLVVCDIELPGGGGIEVASQLRAELPQSRIMLLTGYCTDGLINAAVSAHVNGYFLKTDPIEDLIQAMKSVSRDLQFFSPAIRERLTTGSNGDLRIRQSSSMAALSERQIEILRHIAAGLSVKEIARLIHVTPKTVESHKYRLMKLLNIHDRVALTHFALEHGLLPRQPQNLIA